MILYEICQYYYVFSILFYFIFIKKNTIVIQRFNLKIWGGEKNKNNKKNIKKLNFFLQISIQTDDTVSALYSAFTDVYKSILKSIYKF